MRSAEPKELTGLQLRVRPRDTRRGRVWYARLTSDGAQIWKGGPYATISLMRHAVWRFLCELTGDYS